MREFIEQYCVRLDPKRVQQLAKKVIKEAGRKPPKLHLPKTTNDAQGNKKKYFRPSDLRSNWSTYLDVVPNLPALK